MIRRTLAVLTALAAAFVLTATAGAQRSSGSLVGAGSSFVAPLVSAWIPKVDSAMTTEAGPQLFSDCHTCFISSNTTAAGAAFGSGAGIATAAGSAAGAVRVT